MIIRYRIVIERTGETVANAIDSRAQADEVLHFKQLDIPHETLVIEEYATSPVKPGFGRDPDLH